MENYKEKYECALETIQEILNSDSDLIMMSRLKLRLQSVFPELKESEDEKIRKEIINYFQCQSRDEPSRKDTHNKWIAWIEKQGVKTKEWSEEDENMANDLIEGLLSPEKTHHLAHTSKEIADWLKSLKDRMI